MAYRNRTRRAAGRHAVMCGAVASMMLAGVPASGSAHAADLPPAAAPSPARPVEAAPEWHFQATMYGWLTAIDGDVGVRNLPAMPVHASVVEVLENLDGAVMGSFLASNERWLVLTDLVLAKLSHSARIGPTGRTSLDADLSQAIATAAVGAWLPLGIPDVDLAITGGLRYLRLSTEMSLTPAGLPFAVSRSQSRSWIDPTVGLAVRWTINPRWFVNAVADIGGFGVGSKLSSNGYAGLGYMWTPSISTAIGYRYLYEDYEEAGARGGAFRYNATMHGPTFSLAWHF